jgi:hypothetical protein
MEDYLARFLVVTAVGMGLTAPISWIAPDPQRCDGPLPVYHRASHAGDKVLIMTPAYANRFMRLLKTPAARWRKLSFGAAERTGPSISSLWRRACAGQRPAMIFCNPHNPVGRVWSREELEQGRRTVRKVIRGLSRLRRGGTRCELFGHRYTSMAVSVRRRR